MIDQMKGLMRLTEGVAVHGEGPIWSEKLGGLIWVDMLEGDVLALEPRSRNFRRRHVGKVAACVRPRRKGGFVVALEDSIALFGAAGVQERVVRAFTDETIRFNEGTCDSSGNFYCGTMAYDETPGIASLFCLSAAGQLSTSLAGLTISNGIQFLPDGRAIFVDSADRRIDFLEPLGPGRFDRRPFIDVNESDGVPDGICLDSVGGIWVALWGAGRVNRYDEFGRLSRVVELPTKQVTACTLGGPLGSTLFITTSRFGMEAPDEAAGSLFAIDVDQVGYPVLEFWG